MKLAEIKAERMRQGLSQRDLSLITGMGINSIYRIENGMRIKKKSVDILLKALGMPGTADDIEDVPQDEYCIGEKPEIAGRHKEEKPKKVHPVYQGTLAMDAKDAARLGLPYGEYMARKETGTLDLYKEQHAALEERDKGANVIESHIGGASVVYKVTNVSKL